MNVAYLLVSTAWLSGQAPAAKMDAAPVVVQPAPAIGGGCGCDSGCGCDTGCCESGWKHRFKERMSGLFKRRSHGGDCCDTCAPAPAPTCCAPATCGGSCDSCCESGHGHKFRDRLSGLFKRRGHGCEADCGCGTGCSSCGGAVLAPGGTMIPGKGAEMIPPPKDGTPPAKMPSDKNGEPPAKNGDAPAKGVQINVVPNAPVPAAAPALEAAPTIAPAPAPADADNKEQRTPF